MSAIYRHGDCLFTDYTPATDVTAGDILHLNGQAAIAHSDLEAGILAAVSVPVGQTVYEVAKATDTIILDGGKVFWDPVSATASYKKLSNSAFFLGTAVGDYETADATLRVRVNHRQNVDLDIARDAADSVAVNAATCTRQGGTSVLKFTTAAEAQKIDLISKEGIAAGQGFIAEGILEVVTNGDDAAVDANFGIANGTDSDSADDITESVFIHLDGASVNISAESDDGTTEVAATDTTVDFTAGTPFEYWIDARDLSDIVVYLDGARVLSGSTFKLDNASGPLYLINHIEKTANDSPGEYHVDAQTLRLAN